MVSPATASGRLSSDVLQSERLDDLGQHVEAVDCLVAGVRKNDIEAITRLGKRLLIGDRAPHLPADGLRFLAEARDRGGAEPAAILAVCLAAGVQGRPDLPRGWASLILAAERGWQPAQDQIRVIAEDSSREAAPRDRVAGTPWRQLAECVDPASWLRPPPQIEINETPLIRSYAAFIGPAMGQWIIGRSKGRLSRALVYDAGTSRTTTHSTRTNTAAVFNLLDTDFVCVLMQTRMAACLDLPFRYLEAMTVLHYDVGEHISEHFDFVDPNIPDYAQHVQERGQRIVTFLVYLNDDYDGGETEFPRVGISHKGRSGEGLYFVNALPDGSPDMRTLHAGRAPTRGEKWIVSQFIKNRPAF